MYSSREYLNAYLKHLGLEADSDEFKTIFYYQNHQTLSFYADIMQTIQETVFGHSEISILDVGSRTGIGADYLGRMFSQYSYSRIKATVTALDISPRFKQLSEEVHPWVRAYLVGDVQEMQLSPNWIVCSHTIEHVSDPDRFLNRLLDIATDYVVVACPIMEGRGNLAASETLIEGHVNSIDYSFFQKFSPVMLRVYRSLVWHQSLACVGLFRGRGSAAIV